MNSESTGPKPCSLPRRLLAMGYDTVIVLGLLLIGAALVSPLDSGNQHALQDPAFTAYLLMIWFFYLACCWIKGGMTVGMRAWRLTLVADQGVSIGWKFCLLRFSVSLLSVAAFGLGFLWSLFDRRRRCWHDLASRSGIYRSD